MAQPRALLLHRSPGRLNAGLRDRFRSFAFAYTVAVGRLVLLVANDPYDNAAAGGPVVQMLPSAAACPEGA